MSLGRVLTFPVRFVKRKVSHTMSSILMGIARHALTTLGGALVSQGYIGASDLEAGVGAIFTLIGVGLSVYHKVAKKS